MSESVTTAASGTSEANAGRSPNGDELTVRATAAVAAYGWRTTRSFPWRTRTFPMALSDPSYATSLLGDLLGDLQYLADERQVDFGSVITAARKRFDAQCAAENLDHRVGDLVELTSDAARSRQREVGSGRPRRGWVDRHLPQSAKEHRYVIAFPGERTGQQFRADELRPAPAFSPIATTAGDITSPATAQKQLIKLRVERTRDGRPTSRTTTGEADLLGALVIWSGASALHLNTSLSALIAAAPEQTSPDRASPAARTATGLPTHGTDAGHPAATPSATMPSSPPGYPTPADRRAERLKRRLADARDADVRGNGIGPEEWNELGVDYVVIDEAAPKDIQVRSAADLDFTDRLDQLLGELRALPQPPALTEAAAEQQAATGQDGPGSAKDQNLPDAAGQDSTTSSLEDFWGRIAENRARFIEQIMTGMIGSGQTKKIGPDHTGELTADQVFSPKDVQALASGHTDLFEQTEHIRDRSHLAQQTGTPASPSGSTHSFSPGSDLSAQTAVEFPCQPGAKPAGGGPAAATGSQRTTRPDVNAGRRRP